jgi:hypothetical protein
LTEYDVSTDMTKESQQEEEEHSGGKRRKSRTEKEKRRWKHLEDREIMPSLTLPWRVVIISRLVQESELKAQFLFLCVKIVYQNSGQRVAATYH